jgi:hypothetical protein
MKLGSPKGGHTHASFAGSIGLSGLHTGQSPSTGRRINFPSPLWKHILQSDTLFPPKN